MQVGHLRQRYLWGPAVDQILAEEDVDGGTPELVKWTLTDHLNTVRDIARYDSETDTTTVVNHLVYDAYGNVTSETNSAVESLFLFTARPFDPDTGLQNNLNRWYDPSVGRWLSEDPIGFAAGDGNLYRYVNNKPVVGVDSTGVVGHIVGGALVGCGGATIYSVGYSLITGDTFCQGCCKAVISCLFGALGGAIATAAPAYEGCIVGFVSGIAESASKQLCHYMCGKAQNADLTCAVATAIVNGVLGCAVKAMAGAEETAEREALAKWLGQVVSRSTGHDIYQLCHIFPPAPPPQGTYACCTFEHHGVLWSETVECSQGQSIESACAERADGWFIDWNVVFTRAGKCAYG